MLSVIIIICTILGGLAAIWYFWDKIMCFFGLQKLEIYFDPNETYQRCIDVSVKKLGIFMHVMVKNEGKSDAKNCKGDLIKVERKNEDGSFSKVRSLSIPVLLKWSHEKNWEPKDIYAKIPIKLDVCYVYQNEKILHFFTEKFHRGLQTDFEPGTYLIRIRVSADNAKPVCGDFIIYWDGNWQNLIMHQYSEIEKPPLLSYGAKEYKEYMQEVQIIKPKNKENLEIGEKYIFEWRVLDSIKDRITHFNLLLSRDGGVTFDYMVNEGKPSGYLLSSSRSWVWKVTHPVTKNAKVRLIAMLSPYENRVDESEIFSIGKDDAIVLENESKKVQFDKKDVEFRYTYVPQQEYYEKRIIQKKKKPKIFIVHGRDLDIMREVKNFFQYQLNLEPIALSSQKSSGRTIIEKFEQETKDVDIAVVILTPDDIGTSASEPDKIQERARQNVIFELGFFLGMLKRLEGRVLLLCKGKIELPSNIAGIIYIDISNGVEAASEEIQRELDEWLK